MSRFGRSLFCKRLAFFSKVRIIEKEAVLEPHVPAMPPIDWFYGRLSIKMALCILPRDRPRRFSGSGMGTLFSGADTLKKRPCAI